MSSAFAGVNAGFFVRRALFFPPLPAGSGGRGKTKGGAAAAPPEGSLSYPFTMRRTSPIFAAASSNNSSVSVAT